ncbi:small ribosomal subunit protein uS3m isoform X3 [Macrobrachium rosenbergii]|uniref:small ribosomal subunit protein uS3m isoform X3 n=1 Tax=Macrobrachium rosenbergii TaxID=79674 RepID=UPI0034D59D1D
MMTTLQYKCAGAVIQNYGQLFRSFPVRSLHTSSVAFKVQSGRYKVTRDQSRPLTYEMANQPCMIGHRKSWNSWNTTSLYEGLREPETAVEDMFIRKFMTGTWHDLFVSEHSRCVVLKELTPMVCQRFMVKLSIPWFYQTTELINSSPRAGPKD